MTTTAILTSSRWCNRRPCHGLSAYFDYKVHKNEQMSPAQLFAILDDFIARTDARLHQSLAG